MRGLCIRCTHSDYLATEPALQKVVYTTEASLNEAIEHSRFAAGPKRYHILFPSYEVLLPLHNRLVVLEPCSNTFVVTTGWTLQ